MKTWFVPLLVGSVSLTLVSCNDSEGFDKADANDDGLVSFEEFDAHMKGEVFSRVDADGDGRISLAEWQKVNAGKKDADFGKTDTNGDGFISRAEADAAFDREGSLKKLFDKIDTNGDGSIDRAESDAFGEKLRG